MKSKIIYIYWIWQGALKAVLLSLWPKIKQYDIRFYIADRDRRLITHRQPFRT
jgi:hypothetical protein